jgi:predicted RNA-binding protein with PUA domain
MEPSKCGCGGKHEPSECAACRGEDVFAYWCDSCERSVPEKRCPYCGLKARKKK